MRNLCRTASSVLWTLPLAVIAGLLLATPTPAQAYDNPKTTVTLVDLEGKPLPATEVSLIPVTSDGKPESGGSPHRNKTKKNGQVVFPFAKPGDYKIEVAGPTGTQILRASVKMRDIDKRVILLPDGSKIEDREGALDPTNPLMLVGIPSVANTVDIALTIGPTPRVVSAATGPAGAGAIDVADRQLKEALSKAVGAIQAEQYAEGLAVVDGLLEKRSEMTPADLAAVLYMRGFALYKLGQGADAVAPLQEAVGLNVKLDPAWDLLGVIFIEQKRFPEATDALGKELELVTDPGRRPGLLLNRALAFRELGKTEESLPLLEEAHQLAPGDVNVIVQLADAYTALGRSEDAEKVIGADLPPAQAAVLNFNIAANFFKTKKWQEAADHFAKCTELDPQMAEAHRYRGEALLSLDRQQEAIVAFEAYLAAAPNATDAATTRQVIDSLKKDIKVREQQQQPPKKKK